MDAARLDTPRRLVQLRNGQRTAGNGLRTHLGNRAHGIKNGVLTGSPDGQRHIQRRLRYIPHQHANRGGLSVRGPEGDGVFDRGSHIGEYSKSAKNRGIKSDSTLNLKSAFADTQPPIKMCNPPSAIIAVADRTFLLAVAYRRMRISD